jgi:two-component sensor histidine kinase/DNA-binding response OmpR family regulator
MNPHEPVNILLVDDTPGKLLSYEAVLQDLGENLIKVTSARDALSELLRTEVAVILTDVCMPHLDGFEFAAMLREHPRCERTAVIFISAVHMADVDYVRGYNSGAVDYVTVPIVPEILRAKVKIFAELYRKTKQLERLNNELEQRVSERTKALETSSAKLRESEQRLRLASQAAGFGTYDYDVGKDQFHWSSELKPFAELAASGPSSIEALLCAVHSDDRDAVRQSMIGDNDTLEGRHEVEFRTVGSDGDIRWILDRGQLFTDISTGVESTRVRGTMLDITERKRAETHQHLLMAELDHRVKNILANVMAIASLSSKQATSVPAFVRALQGRIQSMSTAHDLLRRNNWEGADFHKLARETLRAFQNNDGNIRVGGSAVRLKPKAAQSVALVLHELATNATKHGALSVPQGTVELSCERIVNSGEDHLRFVWREKGGPRVAEPNKEGFGLTALRAAAYEADADVEILFSPDGLSYTLEGPLLVREGESQPSPAPRPMPLAAELPAPTAPKISRILVVEDEPLVALQLQSALEDEGYEVVGPATTLAEGLRLAQNGKFDLALLDINLGVENSSPIALHLSSRRIPFVFSTGYTDSSTLPEQFRSIARLQKPYSIEEIRRVINNSALPQPGTVGN